MFTICIHAPFLSNENKYGYRYTSSLPYFTLFEYPAVNPVARVQRAWPHMNSSSVARRLGQFFARLPDLYPCMSCRESDAAMGVYGMLECSVLEQSCPLVWLGTSHAQMACQHSSSQESARRGPNAMHPDSCAVSCAKFNRTVQTLIQSLECYN